MGNNIIYWNGINTTDIPNDILVDTNVALAMSVKTHRYNDSATQFVKYCHQNNKTLYFAGIHELELRHQLELAYSKEVGLNQFNIKYDSKYNKKGGYKEYYNDLEAKGIDFNKMITPRVEAALSNAKGLMQFLPTVLDLNSFNRLSILRKSAPYEVEVNDLIALITAHDYGINSEVSTDNGLSYINNINLIKIGSNMIRQKQSNVIPFSEGCIYI